MRPAISVAPRAPAAFSHELLAKRRSDLPLDSDHFQVDREIPEQKIKVLCMHVCVYIILS